MKQVLIVQNWVRHYRKPVYNALSETYDVTVVHSGEKSAGDQDRYKEVFVPVRKMGPFFLQPGVLKEIHSNKYGAVVVMFDLRWIFNMLAVFLPRRHRFLYWGHRYSKNGLANRLRDFLMRRADGVVLYSDIEIDRMVANGLPAPRIFVAPNTMHIENHADGSGAEKDSILFSGRAQKRKNVDVLIQAFSEVLPQIPEHIHLNIVGSGAENDTLDALAASLGIADRVIFHGEIVDGEVLRPLFHRAFAYVSPGPVGLAVLHSFAYGLPVVTNFEGKHGPEFGELVDGENALLYHSFVELKAILVRVCTDRETAERLGANAYQRYAEARSLEKMVAGFVEAIEDTRTTA